ncbi:hypothetical protein HQ931_12850 [Enterococcus faecium]|nr:hypothetical protein [Enterococcus faecium]
MEYYEAICILEENESLNFLNYYNIKSDSKYMSKQKKDIALIVIQKNGVLFEHFPEWSIEKKFDYHDWRKKNNYPEIINFISNNHRENYTMESSQLKKIDIDDLLKFFSQKIAKINKNFLLNIDFEYCINDEFKCVELPYSKKSIVLLGRKKKYFSVEEAIYFFHEIGHAIYNSFKYYNNFYVPIELDEFFAHLFEFYFYYTYYSKINVSNELLIYKKILNKKLTNNIIYTDFACQVCQNKFSEEEKQNLLDTIALKNGIDIDLIEKTSWKEIPEIFSYPFYSASYIFIEYFIVSFISRNNMEIDFSKFENNIFSTMYNLSKNWKNINWTEELNKLFSID